MSLPTNHQQAIIWFWDSSTCQITCSRRFRDNRN